MLIMATSLIVICCLGSRPLYIEHVRSILSQDAQPFEKYR